jgi:cell division transport system permease protein
MVRLNVYLRNEEIVVKRLTGATRGFIARPFVSLAFFQGLIAGCVADVLILCSLYLVRNEFYQLFALFDVRLLGAVLLAVIALGIMICIFSTSFSVRNLIPRKYTTK